MRVIVLLSNFDELWFQTCCGHHEMSENDALVVVSSHHQIRTFTGSTPWSEHFQNHQSVLVGLKKVPVLHFVLNVPYSVFSELRKFIRDLYRRRWR